MRCRKAGKKKSTKTAVKSPKAPGHPHTLPPALTALLAGYFQPSASPLLLLLLLPIPSRHPALLRSLLHSGIWCVPQLQEIPDALHHAACARIPRPARLPSKGQPCAGQPAPPPSLPSQKPDSLLPLRLLVLLCFLVFFSPLQLFSALTLQNTPSPSAPRAEATQLRPFPCLAFPSSSSSLRETAPDLILIRLRRCWSVILRERICTDIVFSAFSWPQARLSGLSATHCVAVTCGKRQPEPASQLLVATWKSSVHFLPSVCVCIINSVSLCELSIMYLNTCPSVNDVLRSTPARGSACHRGGTGVVAVPPSPPRCGTGTGMESGSHELLGCAPACWHLGEMGMWGAAGCCGEDGASWHWDGTEQSLSLARRCRGTPMSHAVDTDAGCCKLTKEWDISVHTRGTAGGQRAAGKVQNRLASHGTGWVDMAWVGWMDTAQHRAQSLTLQDTDVSHEAPFWQELPRRVQGAPSPRRLSRAPLESYTQNWGSTQAPARNDSWCCSSPGCGVPCPLCILGMETPAHVNNPGLGSSQC